jgi:hypothetical protein
MSGDYIKAEGKAGRMGARLMAIVAEGDRGRVYLAPTPEMEAIALTAQPTWKPEGDIPMPETGWQLHALRTDHLRRPLHPPPARRADDLLRPGAGSARAGEARRPRRRPARRRPALAKAARARSGLCGCGGGVFGVCAWTRRRLQHNSALGAQQRKCQASAPLADRHSDGLGLFRGKSTLARGRLGISRCHRRWHCAFRHVQAKALSV